MSTAQLTARPRWRRFTLRLLLGVVAVLALPLAWIGNELHHIRQEQAAIATLRQQNHGVTLEPSKHWLQGKIAGFDALTAGSVVVGSTSNDATLELIGRLQNLHAVRISSRQVTDEGIKQLARLQQLTQVSLRAECVTDDALAQLARLPKLERLTIQVAISDRGMAELTRLKGLKQLFIVSRTMDVTDRGLDHLEGLSELEIASLVCPGASAEGFGRLAQALPNCKVRNDSWQFFGR